MEENAKKENFIQKFLWLISPTIYFSAPGAFVLFYYQIHIGNLPGFISQTNSLWTALSISLTAILGYSFMLGWGALSAFWLYAMLVCFFREWKKVRPLPGNGLFPWNAFGWTKEDFKTSGLNIWRSINFSMLGRIFFMIAVIVILTAAQNYLTINLNDSAHSVTNKPPVPVSNIAHGTQIQNSHHSEQPSGIFSNPFIFLLESFVISITATSLWQIFRKKYIPQDSSMIKNSLPLSDRGWYFYIIIALSISLALTVIIWLRLIIRPETFFITALLCNIGTAILPIILWLGCYSLPQQRTPPAHNIFPNNASSILLYSLMSACAFLLLFLIYALNSEENGFIGFVLYFFASGFVFLVLADITPRNKIKKSMPFGFIFIVLFAIFHGSWSTITRELLSIAGFHTWRQDVVLVTPEVADEISGLLSAYNIEPETCRTTLSGKEMVKISTTLNGAHLPLQVLWNDGSEKRLLGFDTELIPYKNSGPILFIPPVSTDNSNIVEVTARYLAPCTPD